MSSSSNWRARNGTTDGTTSAPPAIPPPAPAAQKPTCIVGILTLKRIVNEINPIPRENLASNIMGTMATANDTNIWREAVTHVHAEIIDKEAAIETALDFLQARGVKAPGGNLVGKAVEGRVPKLTDRDWIKVATDVALKKEFVDSVVEHWEKKSMTETLAQVMRDHR